ncbi:MAG: Prenyltransferase and squalene oxidase repeat protein [Methanosaeta sp. PtaU1.Bin060]|nr:MAG: Prenyltransferase and squalene oxidase repeat protein [Methanosaeta sp. PtaU1.Bin060]
MEERRTKPNGLALAFACIILLTLNSNAENVSMCIESSTSYILSCQNTDGGFGQAPGTLSNNDYTAEAAMALAQTGNIESALKGGKTPLDYLTANPPSESTSSYAAVLGKYLMGVLAAGGDPSNIDGVNYVQKLKDATKSGLQAYPFADALVLLGLAATGEGGSQEAKDYVSLVKAAQSDGGWWNDVDSTGLMVNALIAVGESPKSSTIKDAMKFLSKAQNSDGGFPGMAGPASNSDSDACAIMAINAKGDAISDWSKNGKTPVAHLLSCQQPGGLIWWKPDASGAIGYYMMQTSWGAIALDGGYLPTV